MGAWPFSINASRGHKLRFLTSPDLPEFPQTLLNFGYIQAAVNQLRANGDSVNDADVARPSPLLYEYINMMGRYSFSMPEAVAKGELLSLIHI